MRKIVSLIMFMAVMLPSFADQSADLQNILKACSQDSHFVVGFTEKRKLYNQEEMNLSGTLTYDAKGELSMEYSSPEGDYFVISGNIMNIKRGEEKFRYDLSKNRPMSSLSKTIMSAFKGTMSELAEMLDATLSTENTKEAIVVSLTANKRSVRGYSKVTAYYKPGTYQLFKMDMEEFDGSFTSYLLKR